LYFSRKISSLIFIKWYLSASFVKHRRKYETHRKIKFNNIITFSELEIKVLLKIKIVCLICLHLSFPNC